MAGAFEPGSDIRDDVSSAGSVHENEGKENRPPQRQYRSTEQDDSSLLPPQFDVPSSLLDDSRAQDSQLSEGRYDLPGVTNTVLEEEEMKKRLADFESSFLPEPSALSEQVDSTSASLPADIFDPKLHDSQTTGGVPTYGRSDPQEPQEQFVATSTHSPMDLSFKTPVTDQFPDVQEEEETVKKNDRTPNTSALEQMSSSPTAARTVSRAQSMASMGGYETATEREYPDSPTRKRAHSMGQDPDATPRKDRGNTLSSLDTSGTIEVKVEDFDAAPLNVTRRRPQYLSKRSSNARLSYDSMTSSATETSEATLGADYALQTGGAAPESTRLRRRPNMTLSRSTSLGSLASGVSNISDDEGITVQKRSGMGIPPELSTLQEESPSVSKHIRTGSPNLTITPRASTMRLSMPTDSVIANHVRDLEVPDTVARQFRSERSRSPEKNLSMATMTPGPKRGLTLKEHRSTVEKLGKENFDLKMKIHFLDQALQKRSEDGIKEMITENVQLKSDRLRLEKDNHNLRKQIRDLQRKLEEATGKNETDDQGYATDEERSPTVEEEVLYLRERTEIMETEMEKLRQENINKESDKRRLAEMMRNLGDSRPGGSEVGSREERDMWKDMLEAETIAREQAEDDARKLREELAKLKQDSSRPGSKLRVVNGLIVSRSSSVDTSKHKADNAELERLRHECSELQKTIGAQASALTSRNKEKEMLYQEIENLKLGRMGGLRSVAGDSILERSASRARSNSRASNGTRYTRLSDGERETLENKIDQLRDEVSQLKLDKQNLQNQFDEALTELDAVDAQAQADADQFNEELSIIAHERDNAVRDAEEQDQAFQQLKNEAQEEIDGLGDELDAKIEECNRLEHDLKAQADNVKELQAEMRSATEGLIRLEEDAQQNLARYQAVKAELDDSNRELENLERNLHDAQNKNKHLTVQQESSQNEIAFLREEQDANNIKIGDLESLLKKTHLNLDAERDRVRELERHLNEERTQHESIANQEKQEIQRTINELNREASTSKNELRQVRKMLSQREIEVSGFKEKLTHLEDSLRETLGISQSTSPHLVGAVTKLMQELEQANHDLGSTRQHLDEHKRLLNDRDLLLEDAMHDTKRLEDLLDKERSFRRQDKHSFEQALRSHEQATLIQSKSNVRLAELEQARLAHRQQLSKVEAQYKDQLAERNQVLLTIWRKLSVMCGPDWAHNHSLINGNLPSQEVIGNTLFWPGFSRNLLLAAKQVEGVLSSFKDKIKTVERDLYRNYNSLEKEFEARNKKLERVEQHWEAIKLREREIEAGLATSQGIRPFRTLGMQKLRNENKLLKAELRLYQDSLHGSHPGHAKSHERTAGTESRGSNVSGGQIYQHDGAYTPTDTASMSVTGAAGIPTRRSSMQGQKRSTNSSVTLSRHNSTNAVETLSNRSESANGRNSSFGFTIGNPGTALAASSVQSQSSTTESNTSKSKEDMRRSLVVPSAPTQYPVNGNFGIPPGSSHSNRSSEAGTAGATSATGKGDDNKWIHRLRELERRLKVEREQRLVDRDGARRRLEERDEQNDHLKRQLERERLGRGWRQDHEERGGYLVADEPMLNEVVGQLNAPQTISSQTREEYVPETPDERVDPMDQQDEDEGLRTSEEDRLMSQAQFPSVGSSHAQRVALKQQGRTSRPESLRTVSRGSIVNLVRNGSYGSTQALSNTGARRPSDTTGRTNSGSGSADRETDRGRDRARDRTSIASGSTSGERWGKNGCEKDSIPPTNPRMAAGEGENTGMRRALRTASSMAGISGL